MKAYEPVLHVAEIMLTLVTVRDPPLAPEAELLADVEAALLGDEELGAAEFSIVPTLVLPMRPVTSTWWPTCSARFTDESAISMMSFEPRVPLMLPAVRELSDGELDELPAAVPDDPLAEPAMPLLSLEPPILALFNRKPPPLPVVALLLLADALLSRCRQPVALICPAISFGERPVVACPLCGLDVVGLCVGLGVGLGVGLWAGVCVGGGFCGALCVGLWAAKVPHRATLLQIVTAHCR